MQVLVASPPLQEFFSQPNAKLHQGPLGSALQELFEQVQAGKLIKLPVPEISTMHLARQHVYIWATFPKMHTSYMKCTKIHSCFLRQHS